MKNPCLPRSVPHLATLEGARSAPLAACTALGIAAWLVAAETAAQTPLDAAELKELAETYCTECHNLDDYYGGLDLELFDFADVAKQAQVSEKIVRKLSAGVMPPPGKPRPDASTNSALIHALTSKLDAAWEQNPVLVPPGAHRLNRQEYANAIRDLLDVHEANSSPAMSGTFEDYLRLPQTIEQELPPRSDAISRYLDALDREFSKP